MSKQGIKYPAAIAMILGGVLAMEGGYVNHPSDPGGETNFGITKQVAVNNGYTDSMRELPKELAVSIYYDDYIYKPGYVPVVMLSPVIGEKLVDASVNTGVGRSSKWYQESLNNLSRGCKDYKCITVDGKVGTNTLKAHQGLITKRGPVLACKLLLRSIESYQGSHYLSLKHLSDFTVGWMTNRIGNIPEEKCENE
jgi:lysozyme family protein